MNIQTYRQRTLRYYNKDHNNYQLTEISYELHSYCITLLRWGLYDICHLNILSMLSTIVAPKIVLVLLIARPGDDFNLVFYHDVADLGALSQSDGLNLVMWPVIVR